ncbi:MAG: putative phage tail assembly chaperone [Desulfovibrio sp.]|uniref:putative phage tail assembly chaperone n=1 Tax=Desulfovibrio sp. 7SRBS1 TaxID=3378064 RepID=UPI003B3CDC7C
MEKTITLKVNGEPFSFNMTSEAYNAFLDETEPGKKVGPSHNLLMRTVAPENKDALRELLTQPAAAILLMQSLTEHYVPDLNIEVGE